MWHGRLWLRGRVSILLSEGHWFDSPGLHVEVSLGEILNPSLQPDVLVSTWHCSHRHWCMFVWITVSLFGQKCLLNVLEANIHLYRCALRFCIALWCVRRVWKPLTYVIYFDWYSYWRNIEQKLLLSWWLTVENNFVQNALRHHQVGQSWILTFVHSSVSQV